MDANILVALGGVLTVVGGGIAWIVTQVRIMRHERYEDALSAQKLRAELYLAEIEKLQISLDGYRAALTQVNSDRLSYHRQLIAHHIEPDPAYREVPNV
ncbi:hypothetical protein [Devriesea agamarum]|uniref:hypothetical protein n=1 Tax=Devriesea agamarum TaxID=472569 RepID=UPI00071DDA95|nr:hypothetical protein [Devriesea agamarum]